MSVTARVRGRRVLVGVILAICATAGSPRTSLSQQQELKGEGLALDLLERLEYTRAGADAVTASMSLVEFEEKYCLPPDPPSKAREEQFLKSRQASVDEYKRRYNSLRAQLLTLITNDGGARRVVDAKFAGNPMEDQAWQPWQDAFKRATDAINAKKAELKPIPVEPCRELPPQQPPPEPPPPAGPGIDLPQPKVRPVAYPTFKLPFCSESDKQTVIQAFRAVAWDYYMNYQDARVYHDAITEALAQGRGNASVLRGLLPGARKSLDVHAKALDDFNKELDRVRAMKVEDCEEKQQPAPDPIPPLVFDPFVFPAVPDEFCTQDAKDETVRQLQAARNTARRNYDKAAARITELGERITRGDNSPATSAAFREANQQASEWLQQSQKLDADMQRAAAMPVVQCATPVQKSVPQHSFGTGIKAGLTFAATNFPKFGEIVGDRPGITEYSANDTPIYYGPFVEFNVAEQVRFGASVLFGTHSFTQGYTGSEITGQVGGIFADTRVSYAYPIGKVNLLGGAGITWAYNNLSDVVQVNGVVTELPGKTLSGFMANLGAAIETALLGRFGGRFSADYITSFKQPNADEHWRASFTLFHAF